MESSRDKLQEYVIKNRGEYVIKFVYSSCHVYYNQMRVCALRNPTIISRRREQIICPRSKLIKAWAYTDVGSCLVCVVSLSPSCGHKTAEIGITYYLKMLGSTMLTWGLIFYYYVRTKQDSGKRSFVTRIPTACFEDSLNYIK